MTATDAPSYGEIDAALCAPGTPFEIETAEVFGRAARLWRNAPGCLGDALAVGRAAGNGRDFFVLGEERLSHDRHYELVAALAEALVDELGVTKGDRVAIAMRNLPEWSIAFFATTMVGAIAVPLNAFWNGAELAFAVTDSDPKVVIADGERLERLEPHVGEFGAVTLVGTRLDDRTGTAALPPGVVALDALVDRSGASPPAVKVAPDDYATIFYTSGTTGFPKGVLGTHRNICTNLISLMYAGTRTALRSGARPGRGSTAGNGHAGAGAAVPRHGVSLDPRCSGVPRGHPGVHAQVGPGDRARPHRAGASHGHVGCPGDGVGPRQLADTPPA